jgi:3',5'-cyclic AMP phosphodiesterase CpdA
MLHNRLHKTANLRISLYNLQKKIQERKINNALHINEYKVDPAKEFSNQYILDKHRHKEDNLSYRQKFTIFTKQYGVTYIGTSIAIWSLICTSSYLSFKTGIVNSSHYVEYIDKGIDFYNSTLSKLDSIVDTNTLKINEKTPKTENIILALFIGKVTKPLQLALNIYLTPKISRALGLAPNKI